MMWNNYVKQLSSINLTVPLNPLTSVSKVPLTPRLTNQAPQMSAMLTSAKSHWSMLALREDASSQWENHKNIAFVQSQPPTHLYVASVYISTRACPMPSLHRCICTLWILRVLHIGWVRVWEKHNHCLFTHLYTYIIIYSYMSKIFKLLTIL